MSELDTLANVVFSESPAKGLKRQVAQIYADAAYADCEVIHHTNNGKKRCAECGATDTPQWRQGPAGPQTLCNACGVRHSRLVRRLRGGKKRSPARGCDSDHQDASDTNTDTNSKEGVTISLFPLDHDVVTPTISTPPRLSGRSSITNSAHTTIPDQQDTTKALIVDQVPAEPEDDTPECEAAMNLLSMASGEPKTAEADTEMDFDIVSVMKGDTLQRLLPLLTSHQLSHLKQLCEEFDNCYKDLVAAHAARDAVAKILAAKQEEAAAADRTARNAAQALYEEAKKLSCLQLVRSAMTKGDAANTASPLKGSGGKPGGGARGGAGSSGSGSSRSSGRASAR
eukprot:CAMPEP_0202898950 /NCGR_PEP_ID=MMETSP1392-20130828/7330_1 /ASSEMBLY_ACC=CAM_ASM_000868 /TAXON_ID=225041 /ORGANISM="Chlamydomonas chlamydogama, Strain SAG 11-48b" /LENGTH=340 /DNA_ID=CAMNT_0049585021 /DNA_START=187 /DNA_END=1209 /DNA_ORIENTATION=-